jgi:tetratricopeptide (TPR) repeat protein
MNPLTVTFDLPAEIAKKLLTGEYERVGGVIRKTLGKQVVAWLRDIPQAGGIVPPSGIMPVDPLTGALNILATLVKSGIDARGFSDVNKRLDGISQQIGQIGLEVGQMKGLLQLTSATSILNLGVSVIGFAVIAHRINELEKRLSQAEEILKKIDYKIDLGFYAKFRAALDLASNAFRMTDRENRRSSALSAITLFLEAEKIYLSYVDHELQQKSQIADEYLLTLALAYLAEIRCYLELGEYDTALNRFHEGSERLSSRIRQYIEILLTSNPAAYLSPQFKDQIDLRRLTRIYQWFDASLDENAVFELQRDNLFNLKTKQSIESGYEWVNQLPPAIVASAEVKGSIFGNREEMKQEAIKRLPQVMEIMESMIETSYRFEMYRTEVEAISQLGISFYEWLKLAPAESQPEGRNLMFIVPTEPLTI